MSSTLSDLGQRALRIVAAAGPLVLLLVLGTCVFLIAKAFYNIYWHPLRHIPGPKLWISSHLVRHYYNINGRMDSSLLRFHERYGEAVRFSPDEVSFTCPQAWQDIYGHLHKQLPKDPTFMKPPFETTAVPTVLRSSDEDHSRMRRKMAHAFSDRALKEQEPCLQKHVGRLMKRLYEVADTGEQQNMVTWYNFTTFDVIGDLAFGLEDGFECLTNNRLHHWVAIIFAGVKGASYVRFMNTYPLLITFFKLFESKDLKKARVDHEAFAMDTAAQRMDKGVMPERKDFWSYMLKQRNDKDVMTREELLSNSDPLVIAGAETTATLLSGVTFHLLKNPATMKRLTDEIRSAFSNEEELTFDNTTAKLPYLQACLEEGLRMYPPVPTLLPRRTLPGAPTTIAGYDVPEWTAVGVHHLSAYRSENNWHQPYQFAPERWLKETTSDRSSPYYNDRRDSLQPFQLGPRNCIGKHLAYNEMRLVLAKTLFSFDLELCQESYNWDKQPTYLLWEKGPLKCYVRKHKA